MTCGKCKALFVDLDQASSRAEAIARNFPDCACEPCAVSQWSEAPVDPGETLVRFVVDPTHLYEDADGIRLKSSFFSDAVSQGASCLRLQLAEPREYHDQVKSLLESQPTASDGSAKKLYGVILVDVSTIREIEHEIEIPVENKKPDIFKCRALCVYATGLPHAPNHADIFVNIRENPKVSKSKANRAALRLTERCQGSIMKAVQFRETVDLTAYTAAS